MKNFKDNIEKINVRFTRSFYEVLQSIELEVIKAEGKHPDFARNLGHALHVVAEELGEAHRAYLQYEYEGKHFEEIRKELIQTGATVFRTLLNFDYYVEEIALERLKTASENTYTQLIGRGLRPYQEKTIEDFKVNLKSSAGKSDSETAKDIFTEGQIIDMLGKPGRFGELVKDAPGNAEAIDEAFEAFKCNLIKERVGEERYLRYINEHVWSKSAEAFSLWYDRRNFEAKDYVSGRLADGTKPSYTYSTNIPYSGVDACQCDVCKSKRQPLANPYQWQAEAYAMLTGDSQVKKAMDIADTITKATTEAVKAINNSITNDSLKAHKDAIKRANDALRNQGLKRHEEFASFWDMGFNGNYKRYGRTHTMLQLMYVTPGKFLLAMPTGSGGDITVNVKPNRITFGRVYNSHGKHVQDEVKRVEIFNSQISDRAPHGFEYSHSVSVRTPQNGLKLTIVYKRKNK